MSTVPLRIRMRVHDVKSYPSNPETRRPARELVEAVAIDDGSNYDRAWSIEGPPGWATLSLEITHPAALGQLVKGRVLDVAIAQLEPREVTVSPAPAGARSTVKGIGNS